MVRVLSPISVLCARAVNNICFRYLFTSSKLINMSDSIIKVIESDRANVTKSVLEFDYNKKRIKVLSTEKNLKNGSNGVVYWMSREMRVQDNWSFLFAQRLALKFKVPLYVIYFFSALPDDYKFRQTKFLLKGLHEVAQECSALKIPFYLCEGNTEKLVNIVKVENLGAVVIDFSPLREFANCVQELQEQLPDDVVFCQVDGHNIVPCWEASPKLEYAARTIRPKIMNQLTEYLTPFPPLISHPHSSKKGLNVTHDAKFFALYSATDLPEWATPGYKGGIGILESFCNERLKLYAGSRNDPNLDASSNLSPWLHFGQIAAQRCVLEAFKQKKKYVESFNSFVEEIVVRRELTDNFCHYNENYDNFNGAADWAKTTLNEHRKDKRPILYNAEQFEESKTHDPLWNAAQLQLVNNAKLHGFLRMYWCKKILEWSASPEDAIETAIKLNDTYSLDGKDPNGYVGIMWSICGIHDQGWRQRDIFGKIRYMNYEGCMRKFDVVDYVQKWGRKEDYVTAMRLKKEPARKRKRPN